MSSLIPFYITAFDKGLINNKKPFLIPDEAFSILENAFVFRDRVTKRLGLQLLGRLSRTFSSITLTNQANGSSYTANLLTDAATNVRIAPQTNSVVVPGSVSITVGAIVFTDPLKNGVLTVSGSNSGNINYSTGVIILNFNPAIGATSVVVTFAYNPALPGMGISLRDNANVEGEQTIWFDRMFAYDWTGTSFTEFIPGTTWTGSDSQFFWTYSYRGPQPFDKLFFETNFNINDPMRFANTAGNMWTNFAPAITATNTLYQAQFIIAYYSRLLLFNTWEGTTAGGAGMANNIQNRLAFSALGDPTAVNAFRRDIFGQGGVIDAPTSEAITGVMFVKNTLIVKFEETTWQLTYVGEYGTPFVWERVSSDYGSNSPYSEILFDNHMLDVGDVGITASNAVGSQRIDLQIPDQVFDVQTINNGAIRVWGVRDYQKEVVYWNYPDANTQSSDTTTLTFPNKVMVYNYRNNTWAIFRDNVTAFGYFRLSNNLTWDSTSVTWDDNQVTWDDIDDEENFPSIVSVNQQGFVHLYGYKSPDDASLSVDAINLSVSPIQITSANHNLQPGEIIELINLNFVNTAATPFTPVATNLNGQTFQVTIIDPNTLSIAQWNPITQGYATDQTNWINPANPSQSQPATPSPTNTSYVGGGTMVLFPKLNVQTKDINIFQDKGLNTKLSYIDFLMQPTANSAFSVLLALNATLGLPPAVIGNLSTTSNISTNTNQDSGFYSGFSDYAWFRFFSTTYCQFFRLCMTYDDNLMNTLNTHAQPWTLYAMTAYCRPGGKTLFA